MCCNCLEISINKGCTLIFGMIVSVCGVVIAFLSVNSMMMNEWMSSIYEFEATGTLAGINKTMHIGFFILSGILLLLGLLGIPTVIK